VRGREDRSGEGDNEGGWEEEQEGRSEGELYTFYISNQTSTQLNTFVIYLNSFSRSLLSGVFGSRR
jgi:hypothetical protein